MPLVRVVEEYPLALSFELITQEEAWMDTDPLFKNDKKIQVPESLLAAREAACLAVHEITMAILDLHVKD